MFGNMIILNSRLNTLLSLLLKKGIISEIEFEEEAKELRRIGMEIWEKEVAEEARAREVRKEQNIFLRIYNSIKYWYKL